VLRAFGSCPGISPSVPPGYMDVNSLT